MRTGLDVGDLDGFLSRRVLATLATYGRDGSVRLSPVWFDWRDGGFDIVIGSRDVKSRHLQRDPRAAVVVYENSPPYRGVELRGIASFTTEGASDVERRIAARYLGAEQAEAWLASGGWTPMHVRLEPGDLRVWDFSDDDLLRP